MGEAVLSGVAIALVLVLGGVSVAAGIAVFVVDSMARATFALLASFLAVAGIFLAIGLVYLALVTALMMTIEMVIMAVFMIMFMMNPAGLMPMSMVHNARGSVLIASSVFVVLSVGIWLVRWPTRAGTAPQNATRQLGEAIMGSHMLAMLVIGIGLFATIVSSTVLITGRGRYDRFGPDLRSSRPDDPVGGGLRR